jgi:hypothetical protein
MKRSALRLLKVKAIFQLVFGDENIKECLYLAQWNKTDDVVGYMSSALMRVKSNFVNILYLQYNNIKGFPKSAKDVASITGGVLNQVFLALQGSKDLKHEIRVALVPPRGKNSKT